MDPMLASITGDNPKELDELFLRHNLSTDKAMSKDTKAVLGRVGGKLNKYCTSIDPDEVAAIRAKRGSLFIENALGTLMTPMDIALSNDVVKTILTSSYETLTTLSKGGVIAFNNKANATTNEYIRNIIYSNTAGDNFNPDGSRDWCVKSTTYSKIPPGWKKYSQYNSADKEKLRNVVQIIKDELQQGNDPFNLATML